VISSDGRFVAFNSLAANLSAGDTNGVSDVFVRDRTLHKTSRVSVSTSGVQGNGDSTNPSISADGRFVAFQSLATNLGAGDTNGSSDVFVRDRTAHTTARISVTPGGSLGNGDSYEPSISANGTRVAFASNATDLVAGDINGEPDVFVRNRSAHSTSRVSVTSSGGQSDGLSAFPSISPEGARVAFSSGATNLVAGDTNASDDVFLRGP